MTDMIESVPKKVNADERASRIRRPHRRALGPDRPHLIGVPTGPAGRILEVGRLGTNPVAGVWPSDHAGVYTRLTAAADT